MLRFSRPNNFAGVKGDDFDFFEPGGEKGRGAEIEDVEIDEKTSQFLRQSPISYLLLPLC